MSRPLTDYFKWRWSASCGRCGYRSRYYRSEWWARVLAVLHTIIKHPYGAMTIAAVDDHQYRANRDGVEINPEVRQ